MSELTVQRTPRLIAAEINSIHSQTQKMLLHNSIEIGRRLVEAKSLLSHGEWAPWLKESVSYSQSTANNFMRIFNEYGADQISLLEENNIKNPVYDRLTYSQAIVMLAMPEEEREEFLNANPVEDMSTRELQEALKARKEAEDKAEAAEKKMASFEEKMEEILAKNTELEKKAKEEEQKVKESAKKAKEEKKKAEEKLSELKGRIKDLEASMEEAAMGTQMALEDGEEDEAENAKKGLSPEELEAERERVRSEVKAQMEQEKALLKRQLEMEIEDVKEDLEAKEKKIKELEVKAAANANENVQIFKVLFEQTLVQGFDKLLKQVSAIHKQDAEMGKKYEGLLDKALVQMQGEIRKYK